MRVHELFRLIKTLSSGEKRFIRQHAQGARSPKYLLLFDQLESQENFDEDALRAGLADEPMLANLTAAANYLLDLLLKRLGEFHLQNRKGHVQNRRLEGIEILYARQIYSLVEKRTKKAWQEAHRMGDAAQEWVCLKWVRRLQRRNARFGWAGFELEKAEMQVMEQLDAEHRLIRLHDQIFQLLRNFGKELPAVQAAELKRHVADLDNLRASAKSFDGRIAWHSAWAFVHELQAQPEAAMQAVAENLQVWYAFPAQLQQQSRRFMGALINFLNLCLANQDRPKFEAAVQRVDVQAGLLPEIQRDLDLRILNIELLFLLQANDYSAAVMLLGTKSKLTAQAGALPSLMYNIAVTYLGARDFSKAGKWINALLEIRKDNIRRDIQEAARLLEIVILIEKKYYDLLPYKTRTLQRQFRNSKIKWVRAFLAFAGKIEKLPPDHQAQQLYLKLASSMQNDQHHDKLGYAEIRIWLEQYVNPDAH